MSEATKMWLVGIFGIVLVATVVIMFFLLFGPDSSLYRV